MCGILVGCAGPAASVGPAADRGTTAATADDHAGNDAFAQSTESPRPVTADDNPDPTARALNDVCGESDRALLAVAAHLAGEQTDSESELDPEAISHALRAAGAPYVWPRAWLFSGSEGELEAARTRMQRWLASFDDGGVRRCGVWLLHQPGGRISVGAVAVSVLADLQALPTRARVGQWLEVRAVLRVPASEAKLVVMGPHGAPHSVPTSLSDGLIRARFNADQPGAWVVQLLGAVEGGPRPLLEALVFAGTEPPRAFAVPKVPGEDAALGAAEPRAALYAMVNAARKSERLAPLERDPRLESLAQAHAETMRHARKTAHDAGDGDLKQRLERLGLELTVGENVAHAGSATLAQRALWASPSHRENLLFPNFDLIGVGVAPDPDGTLWVCQVFGTD